MNDGPLFLLLHVCHWVVLVTSDYMYFCDSALQTAKVDTAYVTSGQSNFTHVYMDGGPYTSQRTAPSPPLKITSSHGWIWTPSNARFPGPTPVQIQTTSRLVQLFYGRPM